MNLLLHFWNSTIGKKVIVAVTGLMLIGFIAGHLLGNLQMFLPPEYINAYAVKLHSLGPLLWVIRFGLLAVFVLHIVATISLARANRKARPQRYAAERTVQASKASLTMVLSGLTILAFVIFHLMHFTVRAGNPEWNEATFNLHGEMVPNVYAMVIQGFSVWWVSAFYVVAMTLLCMHLSHGTASVFQTLGLNGARQKKFISIAGVAFALLIFVGYVSIPASVVLGILRLPQ